VMTRRLALIVLLVVAVCGCKRGAPEGEAPAEERAIAVRAIAVGPQTIERRISLVADVRAMLDADVLAEAAGTVEEMHFYTGDSVARGDLLAVIEHDYRDADVAEATAALAAAQAEAAKASATRARFERVRDKDPSIVKEDDLDAVVAADKGAAAGVDLAEARLQRAHIMLDDAYARAPFAGVVGKRYVDPGDYVNVNEPLYHLVDASRVKVIADVDERDLPSVADGTEARVSVAGLSRPVRAPVYRVAPVVDDRTRSSEVEIRVDNPSGAFRPGMFARVELLVESRRGVLAVPVGAVLAGSSRVYVARDGRAALVEVQTGLSDGILTEITEGLEEGDMVIVSNLDLVRDGSPLSVIGMEE